MWWPHGQEDVHEDTEAVRRPMVTGHAVLLRWWYPFKWVVVEERFCVSLCDRGTSVASGFLGGRGRQGRRTPKEKKPARRQEAQQAASSALIGMVCSRRLMERRGGEGSGSAPVWSLHTVVSRRALRVTVIGRTSHSGFGGRLAVWFMWERVADYAPFGHSDATTS